MEIPTMTQANKKKTWRSLVQFLHTIEDEKDFEKVLETLFTFSEREQVIDRFLIILGLLKGGKPQRALAKELATSISKITRGGNLLKITNKKTKDIFIEYLEKKRPT